MSTSTPPSEGDFRRLYERTSPRVYSYVRRHCHEANCDDVLAEVYLVAWRRYGELPADPVPWLLGTARKTLGHLWRSRDRQQRLIAELHGVQQLAGPDCAVEAVERTDLLTALAALDLDDREVLLLVGWDGMDAAGVAAVLGVSPVAARARLSRARRRLARHYDPPQTATNRSFSLLTEGN
ncbi:MAG: sigma-70 family RNA polymerase sigma factor [Propionibacteriaceae bacterium]|jgi:RNA polymerase sigma-70 factor (ECF subfamily)|nr:sigma-70 family RNA polymerase sigma factor [Propionibacteriaceae bacterium]